MWRENDETWGQFIIIDEMDKPVENYNYKYTYFCCLQENDYCYENQAHYKKDNIAIVNNKDHYYFINKFNNLKKRIFCHCSFMAIAITITIIAML